jgi:hypothetical protein
VETPWYLHFETMWPAGVMAVGVIASLFDPPLSAHDAK